MPDHELTLLLEGGAFFEGPRWRDGRWWVSDMYRRAVFAVGLGVFTLASLACALAPIATFLIVARAVQGMGGAAMFATSLALIAQEFDGRERCTALGSTAPRPACPSPSARCSAVS